MRKIITRGIAFIAKTYLAAAVASPLAEDKIDQVRVMLVDILRREEEDEKLPATQPAVKKLLTSLESDKV